MVVTGAGETTQSDLFVAPRGHAHPMRLAPEAGAAAGVRSMGCPIMRKSARVFSSNGKNMMKGFCLRRDLTASPETSSKNDDAQHRLRAPFWPCAAPVECERSALPISLSHTPSFAASLDRYLSLSLSLSRSLSLSHSLCMFDCTLAIAVEEYCHSSETQIEREKERECV